MTGSAPQLALQHPRLDRSPVDHLLHAINQPLTGLQCSLEIAVTGHHPAAYYLRTLREGLELVSRVRILVEALREAVDLRQTEWRENSLISIDALLNEISGDLQPVALSKGVFLKVNTTGQLLVFSNRLYISTLIFRMIDSVLALADPQSELEVAAWGERGRACVLTSWSEVASSNVSPCSPPILGLLVSQAGWERAGATWRRYSSGAKQSCVVCMPLASSAAQTAKRLEHGESE